MIYLDNAATTPISIEVLDSMKPYFHWKFGNPSSLYTAGVDAKNGIDGARKIISDYLNVKPEEIYFTSGGSESDNWAIKGVAFANLGKHPHIITSKIEHHAVLNTCKWLEERKLATVTYLDVDCYGKINLESLESAINDNTVLVSIMAANNEIGTIQDLESIGKICKEHNVLFHTDAVQAFGHIPIDINKFNIDMMSASGHKINALKGVGFLFIRDGVNIDNLIHGGQQEFGRRASTENVAGIVGLGEAVKYLPKEFEKFKPIDIGFPLIGHPTDRLPHNINILIKGVPSETMLTGLDMSGICVSAGSACASESNEPSHVLKAIGLSDEDANSCIRITYDDIEELYMAIPIIKSWAERLKR